MVSAVLHCPVSCLHQLEVANTKLTTELIMLRVYQRRSAEEEERGLEKEILRGRRNRIRSWADRTRRVVRLIPPSLFSLLNPTYHRHAGQKRPLMRPLSINAYPSNPRTHASSPSNTSRHSLARHGINSGPPRTTHQRPYQH